MTDRPTLLAAIAAADRALITAQDRIAAIDHLGKDPACKECLERDAVRAQLPALQAARIAPRLVYADWCEERGECDEAEFIRLWCQLSVEIPEPALTQVLNGGVQEHLKLIPKVAWDDWARLCRMMRRLGALLADNRKLWTMRGLPEEWEYFSDLEAFCPRTEAGKCGVDSINARDHPHLNFDIGIISSLRIRAEEMLAHGHTILAAHPAVTQVELTSTDGAMIRIVLRAEFPTVARWKLPPQHHGFETEFRSYGTTPIGGYAAG